MLNSFPLNQWEFWIVAFKSRSFCIFQNTHKYIPFSQRKVAPILNATKETKEKGRSWSAEGWKSNLSSDPEKLKELIEVIVGFTCSTNTLESITVLWQLKCIVFVLFWLRWRSDLTLWQIQASGFQRVDNFWPIYMLSKTQHVLFKVLETDLHAWPCVKSFTTKLRSKLMSNWYAILTEPL